MVRVYFHFLQWTGKRSWAVDATSSDSRSFMHVERPLREWTVHNHIRTPLGSVYWTHISLTQPVPSLFGPRAWTGV